MLEVTAGPAAAVVEAGDPRGDALHAGGIVVVLAGAAAGRPGRLRALGRAVGRAPAVEVSLDGTTWEPVEATASLADATLSLYRDPRHGRGEVRFTPREVRFLRLDARLPARPGALEVGP